MKHIYRKGANPELPTLVLFHGTGGTEQDLLPLANYISKDASVLSLRGNILENGMPRFFKRLAEGVFDEEDLLFRTKEIRTFLEQAVQDYELNPQKLVAIGYSNGANIAGSLLFHYSDVFQSAILHHPMVPLRGIDLPDLAGTPVFIGAGTNDRICPPEETEELSQLLSKAGANVSVHWFNQGHQLSSAEAGMAADWYQKQMK